MNLSKMKKLFDQAVDATRVYHDAMGMLTDAEEEMYGFNHNDMEMDDIIDCVDYPQGKMTFKQYHKRMMETKKEIGGD